MDLEYYVSQFSSNDPGEDRFSSRYHPEYGSFFCVIDGHGGSFSCDLTNTFILDYLLEELQKLPKPLNSSGDIIQILNDTFQRCDDLILQEAVRIKNLNLESRCPGRTGCCVALAAVIEGKLYVAHVGDCRVIVCRSLESPSPRPPPTPLLDTHQEPAVLHEPQPSTPSSPQKRTSPRQLSDSMSPSPSKRSRATGGGSDSPSTPFQKPAKKHFFMNRDFHLEAVLEKSNSRKPQSDHSEGPVEEEKAEDEHGPDTGKGGESGHQVPGEVHHEDKEKHQKKKKKKKHKKHLLTEADFDSPEFTGAFQNLGLSLHCVTKDHCCDDKEERIALKLLCPTDPKPMKPSANDKKLFGKEAIKRVGGSLAVTRALGDGYLKVTYLSEEPLKSHVPYITGLPYVSCRTITTGVDLFLLIASDGLWNYITMEEVALIFQKYHHHPRVPSLTSPSDDPQVNPSISEILLNQCLHNAALLAGTSLDCLLAMPSGPYKRNVIDDVTIVVVILPSQAPNS